MSLSEPAGGTPARAGRAERKAARDADPEGAHRDNPMRGRIVSTGDTPASWGNLANLITLARILLAPTFVVLLLVYGPIVDGRVDPLRYLAGAIFVFAIATDFVDGLLARRRNLVTDVGKILDPIADKVLVGGAAVGLSLLGELPWWVTIVILVREVGITVWRFLALRDRVIPAGFLGKVKTWAQAIALAFALIPLWPLLGADWRPANDVVDTVLMAAAVALTVVSGVEYLWNAWRAGRAARSAA
ncbi:MAG: CDP-diacylglycerol--glycerol-3-phosphate 3-phosphatidyltransferase [Actinomycetales bacterium]|nr:CDP-diacylglycerol--glycerol-3-phosphate 3-phosphatidyltransferase [Actinomycetales bacterium]